MDNGILQYNYMGRDRLALPTVGALDELTKLNTKTEILDILSKNTTWKRDNSRIHKTI